MRSRVRKVNSNPSLVRSLGEVCLGRCEAWGGGSTGVWYGRCGLMETPICECNSEIRGTDSRVPVLILFKLVEVNTS